MVKVDFKHPYNGEIKQIKVGFSWTCFFFSTLFGIPLFIRKLYGHAIFMMCLTFVTFIVSFANAMESSDEFSGAILFLQLIGFALCVFYGLQANKMAAQNYIKNGWLIVDKENEIVKFNLQRMGVIIPSSAS